MSGFAQAYIQGHLTPKFYVLGWEDAGIFTPSPSSLKLAKKELRKWENKAKKRAKIREEKLTSIIGSCGTNYEF